MFKRIVKVHLDFFKHNGQPVTRHPFQGLKNDWPSFLQTYTWTSKCSSGTLQRWKNSAYIF